MKEEFDFNSYQKYGQIPKEELDRLDVSLKNHLDSVREERRKIFYALPNDESKINFLRKALINCAGLTSLCEEFLSPYREILVDAVKDSLEFSESELNKAAATRLAVVCAHIAIHQAELVAICDLLTYWKKEAKKREEEISKLQEMMK